jgi:hypothetical protein
MSEHPLSEIQLDLTPYRLACFQKLICDDFLFILRHFQFSEGLRCLNETEEASLNFSLYF